MNFDPSWESSGSSFWTLRPLSVSSVDRRSLPVFLAGARGCNGRRSKVAGATRQTSLNTIPSASLYFQDGRTVGIPKKMRRRCVNDLQDVKFTEKLKDLLPNFE